MFNYLQSPLLHLTYCSMQCHPQTSYEELNLFLFNFFEGGFLIVNNFLKINLVVTYLIRIFTV